jgi:hypothetical protein
MARVEDACTIAETNTRREYLSRRGTPRLVDEWDDSRQVVAGSMF